MLPELYTRVLLAIVGPVDSVNLWKTIFWKGSWTALARRLFFWFASIFIGYAAKNREPATASFQNLGVFRSTLTDQEACFPRASRDDPPFHYKGFGTQGFPRASRDDPDRLWGGV